MYSIRLICLKEAKALTMARKDKKYSISLKDQAYKKLTSMLRFGESKKKAKEDGSIEDKIFSRNTYKTYWKHIKYYLSYLKKNHPECTTLKKARGYVKEWLQLRENEGLSAWTIQTEAKALGKLFGITPEDADYYEPPKRRRQDIKRSRRPTTRDNHFSETRNYEFVCFCRGTGLRRSEITNLKGKDLISKSEIIKELEQIKDVSWHRTALKDALLFENEYFLHIIGKGGRERYSPIIGDHTSQIVARMKATLPENKVWPRVPSNADIHSYRAEYATSIYKNHARDIDSIPEDRIHNGTGKRYKSEVYSCRKDEYGKKLDKQAMFLASKALGHNRIEVVATNYIRGI